MTICAGGTCNNLYISTFSTFFSAFGIPIFEYTHYLNFIVFFFIGLSLISLYSVKRSVIYMPFLLTLVGSLMLLTDMIIYDLDFFTYIGNGLMIIGAIWNSKLNKRTFGRKKWYKQIFNIIKNIIFINENNKDFIHLKSFKFECKAD